MYTLLLWMPAQFSQIALPLLRVRLPDVDIIWLSDDTSPAEVSEALQRANFLVWSGVQITEQLLAQATNLQLVQKWGAGFDGVELGAARRLDIPVANVPGGNATAVAEHFFALIFALAKRICAANVLLHSGRWPQADLIELGLEEVTGKTLGIVGLGHIGRSIAAKALAFGITVQYTKRNRLPTCEEQQLGISFQSLLRLLECSDIICLTLPLTDETRGLFTYSVLRLMKRGSWFINVARGALVDESDLCRVLDEGIVAGAGLDVFQAEPLPTTSLLLQRSNVVLTPHIAGRSKQAMIFITEQCASNVMHSIYGQPLTGLVSLEQ